MNFAVKRTITRRQWHRIRFAFSRTVEYGRKAIQDKKVLPYQQAAQAILMEALAPLNKKERRMVQDALVASAADTFPWAGGNNFSNQADTLIFHLGISL